MSDDDNLTGLDLDLEDDAEGEFDPEFDEELDDDEDSLDDDDDDHDDEDEDEAPEVNPKRTNTGEADLDDEVDPDNLEADLNTILRDRIAAGDDTADDDETDESEAGQPAEMLGSVTPRRDDEWLCEGCFLLVSKSQLGSRTDPRCPSGEEICPSLDRLGP
ncbi:MAG: DUF4193 family protein [bacterium]|nr:DUF4193 family protein [bacterium]